MKILLADDEYSIRIPLTLLLERLGHVVDAVESAEDAIDMLNSEKIDREPDYNLVLTDHAMAGTKTGIDVIKKAKEVSGKTVCWLMSGRVTSIMVRNALDVGALKVLCKPITSAELMEELSKLN